ncbi:MAG TPA: xanthine dehydrogenase family protein subunit M [Acidimicrobiia bacterium]|nr:xanthine dehydrogenase family protein subunit M [Acidimicrobiia bacterium]
MKPAPFEYHAPETVADAVGLLAEYADDVKPLAGGQSLVPMLALRLTRFAHLVDLNRIPELTGVERTNGTLTIRAMTRQRAIERDAQVAAAVPLLGLATPHIGHFQIRNRGTVGGSLAHADPASELPAVALTLDAEFELASTRGSRRVAAADFFEGTWTTTAAEDELLVATHFPVWEGRVGFAFDEVARRHGDFALTGVAAAVELGSDGRVARGAIGFLGMGSTPERARDAEAQLVGSAPPEGAALTELAQLAVRDLEPPDDVHASSRYRTRVGAHLVERTLSRALEAAANA